MASTNFTTHYSIPLPLGTDLTTPMDYNEAAEAVDTALFGAVTDAGNASIAAGNAVNTANAAAEEVDTLGSDLSQEKAKIIALQTRVTNAENEIDDVRADSSDMITAYNEPTATSTHAYAIGDFFIYNNTLYKATAAIAIGATIVPDTNCETTNVSSELIEIKSALTDKYYNNSVTGAANITIHTSTMTVTGSVVSLYLEFESSTAINGLKQIGSINNNIVPSSLGIGVMIGTLVESLGTIVVKNNTDVLVNATLTANTRYVVSVVFVK